MICLICKQDVRNRQHLAHHINTTHGIKMAQYNVQFELDKDDSLLTCPICGQYNLKQLTHHATWKHNMTREELETLYPNQMLWIPEISDRCAEAGKKALSVVQEKLKQNPDYLVDSYKRRSLHRDYEAIAQKIRQTRRINGTNEEMSKRVKLLWQDDCYRKMQSEKTRIQHRQGLTNIIMEKSGKKRFPVTIDNIQYNMRSTWEVRVALSLHERHIPFIYEPFFIPYTYKQETKRYYPDFYIEPYNLIVEVKAKSFCTDERVQLKKLATEQLGYRFMFITEDELNHLETINYK